MAENHSNFSGQLTPHSDTRIRPDMVDLTPQNGTTHAKLTSLQLEKWLSPIAEQIFRADKQPGIDPKVSDSYFTKLFVGLYGLKSAQDVSVFLNSPAGESVQTLLGEQLNEIADLNDFQRQQYQTEQMKKHRLLAFLLMGLIFSRKVHARELNEFIQQQIDARLHHSGTPSLSAKEAEITALQQTLDAYQKSIDAIQSSLDEKINKAQALDEKLIAIDNQAQKLNSRYAIFADHLEQLNDYLNLPPKSSPAYITETQNQIVAIEAQIATLQSQQENTTTPVDDRQAIEGEPTSLTGLRNNELKIKQLSERLAFLQHSIQTPENPEMMIRNRIADLEIQLEKQLDDIQLLLENGRDEEAFALRDEHNGLHLQIAGLKDKLGTMSQDKILLNEHCQQVHSFAEARFILSSQHEKQLVKEGEDYYLVTKGQDIAQLSPQERAQAQKDYQRAKPEISNLSVLVKDNKVAELTFNGERKNTVEAQVDSLQKDLQLLSNQRNQLQASVATIDTRMRQINSPLANNSPMSLPTPKPTPGLQTSNKTNTLSAAGSGYGRMLTSLWPLVFGHGRNPSVEDINRFKNVLAANTDPRKMGELEKILGEIKPGKPMSGEMVKALQRKLAGLGVDEQRSSALETKAAPSPLSTRPSPQK